MRNLETSKNERNCFQVEQRFGPSSGLCIKYFVLRIHCGISQKMNSKLDDCQDQEKQKQKHRSVGVRQLPSTKTTNIIQFIENQF